MQYWPKIEVLRTVTTPDGVRDARGHTIVLCWCGWMFEITYARIERGARG